MNQHFLNDNRHIPARRGLLLAFGLALLVACGGESGSTVSTGSGTVDDTCEDADDPDCGEVLIALTDADGDFLSYGVDVVSLTLTREDGAEVDVLPASTRVDFAELVEVTELLNSAVVPHGRYTGGTIGFDYGTASLFVESGGEPVEAIAIDADGEQILTAQLALDFGGDELVVAPGTPALLTLDFDLNASHIVNLDVVPAEATVEPFLVADIDTEPGENFRVRGPLHAVDVSGERYTIAIRPFFRRDGEFGRMTIHTDDDTAFEIDGVPFDATGGLAALADMPPATATLAVGEYTLAERRFVAREVYAGSSVPGGELDAVHGHVVARAGDTLTVKGATLIRAQSSAVFGGEVSVTLGPDTRVLKAGDGGAEHGIEAISVGQRVTVFGELTEDDAAALALDASAGFVRLLRTNLTGTVVTEADDVMVMALQSIDLRSTSIFDFAGTGAVPEDDADPANYEVALGTLPGEIAGTPVRVIGFVSPFGAAPPDFEALSVTDFSSAHAWLNVIWDEDGTTAPFASLDDTGLIVDLQNPAIGGAHHLRRGAVFTDLFDLAASPLIAPPASGRGSYAIRSGDNVQMFATFAGFEDALGERLDAGGALRRLHAQGGYDATTNTLTARVIRVAMD